MGHAAETASQNIALEWDALSESALKGNRIPLWSGGCGQKLDRDLARIGVRLNR